MVLASVLAATLGGPFPLLCTPWTEEAKLDIPVLVKEAEYLDNCGTGGLIWPTAPEVADLDAQGDYEAGLTALATRGPHLYMLQRLGIFRNRLSLDGPGKVRDFEVTDRMKAEFDARFKVVFGK